MYLFVLESPCCDPILVINAEHTEVFLIKIPLNFKLLYLVEVKELEWRKKDKYLIRTLLG